MADDRPAAVGDDLPLFDVEPYTVADPAPGEPTRPLVLPDGRVRLSFSAIAAFRDCPQRFAFAYRERLPPAPSPSRSYGTAVHAALESYHGRRLPIAPTEQELLDALFRSWDRSGFRRLGRDAELAWYRDAQDVLRRYHARQPEEFRPPAATEVRFELPVDDVALLVGAIDRVDADDDGELRVVDYKTGRLGDRARVTGSLQLALYALACEHLYGRLPSEVALEYVRPGVVVRAGVAELDLDGALTAVRTTAAAVLAGVDEPRVHEGCRWCDFRRRCPAWEGDGPDVLGEVVLERDRLRARVAADTTRLAELDALLGATAGSGPGEPDGADGDDEGAAFS